MQYDLYRFNYFHCWLEQVSNCQQSWPENNYMFFIPITIPEIAASTFLTVTVWTTSGAIIIFPQSWNFELKFFLDIPLLKIICSRGSRVHFYLRNNSKWSKNLNRNFVSIL